MNRCAYIMIIVVLLLSNINTAVAQNRNSLIIARDHLILQIDLQSPKKSIDSILNIAGVNTQYADQVIKGDFTALNKDGWNRTERQNSIFTFDRPLTDLNENPQSAPYLITSQMPQVDGKPGYPAEVKYGVNKFVKATVYGLSSGLTRFILPGYTNVKRVF